MIDDAPRWYSFRLDLSCWVRSLRSVYCLNVVGWRSLLCGLFIGFEVARMRIVSYHCTCLELVRNQLSDLLLHIALCKGGPLLGNCNEIATVGVYSAGIEEYRNNQGKQMSAGNDEDVVDAMTVKGLVNLVSRGDEEQDCGDNAEDRKGGAVEDAEERDTHVLADMLNVCLRGNRERSVWCLDLRYNGRCLPVQ